MTLAEFLKIRRSFRCPACRSRLYHPRRRSLALATGRCPFCATQIIEDLPPLPEPPRETLIEGGSLAAYFLFQAGLCALALLGWECLAVNLGIAGKIDSQALRNWAMVALPVAAACFGLGWLANKPKFKCPACGNHPDFILLRISGRCGHCGTGLAKIPEPNGQPTGSLAHYFRCQTWKGIWTYCLSAALPFFYVLMLLWMVVFPVSAYIGHLAALAWGGVLFAVILGIVVSSSICEGKADLTCPACGKVHGGGTPLPLLEWCHKCGHRLLDLDSGEGVGLQLESRRRVRRAVWRLLGGLFATLGVSLLVLWLFPWDCGPVEDADLKPPPRLEVAAADNAWNSFAPAWQELEQDRDWPSEFVEQVLSGQAWDEARVGELLARHRSALAAFEQGLARQACQPPQAGYLDSRQAGFRNHDRRLARLWMLRLEQERRQGRGADAVETALALYRYGLMLQSHAEDVFQYRQGHYACHQAVLGLRRLAVDPAVPASALQAAERELRPGSSMAFWAPAIDGMLRREYWRICELVDELPKDRRYLMTTGRSTWYDDCFFFWSQVHFFYQPNRTRRELAEHWRHLLAAPGKSDFFLPAYARVSIDQSTFSFNGLGWASASFEILRLYKDHYYYGRRLVSDSRHEYLPAEVALTRILVLCKLYERAHGQRPDSLEALVPEFAEAIPPDPITGRPFLYSKERQVVYAYEDRPENQAVELNPPKDETP